MLQHPGKAGSQWEAAQRQCASCRRSSCYPFCTPTCSGLCTCSRPGVPLYWLLRRSADCRPAVGSAEAVRRLKEVVLLPLLYPDLFRSLHVQPPRCVLQGLSPEVQNHMKPATVQCASCRAVVLPLLYPDLFRSLHVQPPRYICRVLVLRFVVMLGQCEPGAPAAGGQMQLSAPVLGALKADVTASPKASTGSAVCGPAQLTSRAAACACACGIV